MTYTISHSQTCLPADPFGGIGESMFRQARRESGGQAHHDNCHPEPVVHLSVSSATRLRRESAEAERGDCPVKFTRLWRRRRRPGPDNDKYGLYGQTLSNHTYRVIVCTVHTRQGSNDLITCPISTGLSISSTIVPLLLPQ